PVGSEQERDRAGRRLDAARNKVTQVLATTVVVASLYALLAAGYVLVYCATRVLNLAQGDMMTLGGYFLFLVAATVPGRPVLSVVTAAVLSAAAGFPVFRLLMPPMARPPPFPPRRRPGPPPGGPPGAPRVRARPPRSYPPSAAAAGARDPAAPAAGRRRRVDVRPAHGRGGCRAFPRPLRVSAALAARHPDARGRREGAARRAARDQLPALVRALVGARRVCRRAGGHSLREQRASRSVARHPRPESVGGRAGRRARQPGRCHPRRAHRRRDRGALGALRRPVARRRLAVSVPARDAARAPVGALRHPRRAGARVSRV